MTRRPLLLALILVPLLACGCNDGPHSNLPTTRMKIGSRTYTLEIADEPIERETGLMRRDSMPADHGMIFVFPGEAKERTFWMRNTRIPLDILFINAAGQIVALGHMEPHTGTFGTTIPSQYVIELNQGAAARAGVKQGDTLTLPPDVRDLHVTR